MERWGKFYFLSTCVYIQMQGCYFSWSSTSCQHVYAYKWRIVISVEVVDLKMDWISFLCFCDNLALSGSFHWLLYGRCHVGSLYLPSAVWKLLDTLMPFMDGSHCDPPHPQFTFKDVKFKAPQSKCLVVTNTGQRPVHVSFIPKLDDESYSKPWLSVKPSSAVIQPCELLLAAAHYTHSSLLQ